MEFYEVCTRKKNATPCRAPYREHHIFKNTVPDKECSMQHTYSAMERKTRLAMLWYPKLLYIFLGKHLSLSEIFKHIQFYLQSIVD